MPSDKKATIWFFGTSSFAVPYLKTLSAHPEFRIQLVITQPDKAAGRGKKLTAPPVKALALERGLKILQPKNINVDFADSPPKETPPDFFVVVAYGQILSQEMLRIPRVAPINVHYSLLPRWRGAAPIQNAILAGDAVTGVTIQKMVRELDAGDVLAHEKIDIAPRDTFTTLHDRLAQRGVPLVIETLLHPLKPQPQSTSGVTVCRKLSRQDGKVDPSVMTAEEIDRKVRGLNPWPSVTVTLASKNDISINHNIDGLKIVESSLEFTRDSTPLPCARGTTLHLVTVQPAGKKPMTGAEWQRGLRR